MGQSAAIIRLALFGVAWVAVGMSNVHGQDSSAPLGQENNCKGLEIPKFEEGMTRQERVEILDALLRDVLGRSGGCDQVASSGSGTGSGGGLGSGARGQDSGAGGQLRGSQPSPVETITEGSESESSQEPLSGSDEELAEETPDESNESMALSQPTNVPDESKIPEDIPSEDSDNIIARQIRNAAIAEQDPVKQAKLWNSYRQYKGLPQKPVPQAL